MKFLKIIGIAAVSILGLLAFIGWLSPAPARSEASKPAAEQEGAEVKTKPVAMVSSSQVVDWSGLPELVKQKVSDYQTYYLNGSWEQRNAVPFKRESGYYVKVMLDNQQLAKFSESETFSLEDMLTENPHALYGKYKNQWHFDGASGQEINPTVKFNGFNTIDIKRSGNTDEVWIGPIEEMPKALKIVAYEDRDRVYRVDLQSSTK